ncbi:MAG: hypothetical protein VX113_09805, partial [Pseudomonadota bacterium]|nr:hypothetical protein [Pseudomonadota bacterium]
LPETLSAPKYAPLAAFCERVATRPKIAAWLAGTPSAPATETSTGTGTGTGGSLDWQGLLHESGLEGADIELTSSLEALSLDLGGDVDAWTDFALQTAPDFRLASLRVPAAADGSIGFSGACPSGRAPPTEVTLRVRRGGAASCCATWCAMRRGGAPRCRPSLKVVTGCLSTR